MPSPVRPSDCQDPLESLSREQLIARVRALEEQVAHGGPAVTRGEGDKATEGEQGYGGSGGRGTGAGKRKPKREREFDFGRYPHRHVALHLAYNGAKYHGLAAQEDTDNTIEGHLIGALLVTRLIRSRGTCRFSRGGRTDKGVSATGQVVALTLRCSNKPIPDGREGAGPPAGTPDVDIDVVNVINRVLPADIRILGWSPVPDTFDARFSSTHRVYKYFFLRGDLDLERMREGARNFVGTHDFRNFCKVDREKATHFTRTLHSFDVDVLPGTVPGLPCAGERLQLCAFTVKGRAFLWHQVRCMVAALFYVGSGDEDPGVVRKLLDVEEEPCKPQYTMASEQPLVLHEIGYDPPVTFSPGLGQTSHGGQERLVSSCLESLCNICTTQAFAVALLRLVVDDKPMAQWWPAKGHHPGGPDLYKGRKRGTDGQARHVPLLQRSRNPPVRLLSVSGSGGSGATGCSLDAGNVNVNEDGE